MKKLSLIEEEKIVNNYKGQAILKYCKEIGYSYPIVKKVLVKYNLSSVRAMTYLNREDKEKALELYKSGKNGPEIAKLFNISDATVGNILKENNVKSRCNSISSRKHLYNENFFDDIDTEAKAYWLGFIYADGCISERNNIPSQLQINISIKDKGHLVKFYRDLNHSDSPKIITSFTKGAYRKYEIISIRNKKLIAGLLKHGVTPRKSFSTLFPYQIPKEMYRHFIRGYWDGDGSITKNPNRKSLKAIGTYDFLKAIQDIYCLENLLLTKTKISLCNRYSEELYTISKDGTNQAKLLADYLYKDASVYLDRKYNIYKQHYN